MSDNQKGARSPRQKSPRSPQNRGFSVVEEKYDEVLNKVDAKASGTTITYEALFYVVHLIIFYLWLLPLIGSSVREKCEGFWECRRFMKQTWLGYSVDLADTQWRELRSSMTLLWATMIVISVSHYRLRGLWSKDAEGGATASAWFRLIVGLGFLFVQHGRQSIVVLIICYIGYRIAKWQREAKTSSGLVSWLYALAVLLFKESYRLKHLPRFRFLRPIFDHSNGGMYGWQLPANFLVLRIISFSLDLHWAGQFYDAKDQSDASANCSSSSSHVDDVLRTPANSPKDKKDKEYNDIDDKVEVEDEDDDDNDDDDDAAEALAKLGNSSSRKKGVDVGVPKPTCPMSFMTGPISPLSVDSRTRTFSNSTASSQASATTASAEKHCHLDDYNLINYLSYMLYAPLYVAGPIISFNAFVENTKNPQETENPLTYGLRWLLCLGLMEFLTSQFPYFAVISSGLFPHLSPSELAVVAYMTLKIMWLKFLIVWRFFRLWAMADGTLAPENMQRCMSNNCSLEQFWRGWHSSFNKWIVRYMYKPLGGRDSRLASVWPIFLFVAIWHDIEMKLFVWGLLNAVFYVIEILAKKYTKSERMRSLPSSIFHTICTLSGATYIIVLVGVNLIGYAVGVGGVTVILNKILTWDGLVVLFVCYYFLCLAVAFMGFLQRLGLSTQPSTIISELLPSPSIKKSSRKNA